MTGESRDRIAIGARRSPAGSLTAVAVAGEEVGPLFGGISLVGKDVPL